MAEKVSIIIRANESSVSLSRCLRAAVSQARSGAELEVVIAVAVHRRSIHQLARWWNLTFARNEISTRVLYVPSRSGGQALDDSAIRASSGDLIVFLDESVQPQRDWLKQLLDDYRQRESATPSGSASPLLPHLLNDRRTFSVATRPVAEGLASARILPFEKADRSRPDLPRPLVSGSVTQLRETPPGVRPSRYATGTAVLFFAIIVLLRSGNAPARSLFVAIVVSLSLATFVQWSRVRRATGDSSLHRAPSSHQVTTARQEDVRKGRVTWRGTN